MSEDSKVLEKFKANFYARESQKRLSEILIQMFESVGFSIINKCREISNEFDIEIFQSSVEISIAGLQQIKRLLQNDGIKKCLKNLIMEK